MSGTNQIKTLRQAKGLTLDGLAAEMGGVVTKQALSKYEQDKARPSPVVAARLASALGVKAMQLFSEPRYQVEFLGYRKRASMGVLEREQVESWAAVQLRERTELQERLEGPPASGLELRGLPVGDLEAVEAAATQLRVAWELGLDPIPSVTDALETRRVHVLTAAVTRKFDGISAMIRNEIGEVVGAGVVCQRHIHGERQRMNLAHELGHLVLEVAEGLDEESAATRFAGAFLLPEAAMYRELGPARSRTRLSYDELIVLKRRFGVSMQALVYRAWVLGIVTGEFKNEWFRAISARGWRKSEPEPLPLEEPQRWTQMVARAQAEGLATRAEVCRYLDVQETDVSEPSLDRRAFLGLPVAQRRALLHAQAQEAAPLYRPGTATMEWVEDYVDEDTFDEE